MITKLFLLWLWLLTWIIKQFIHNKLQTFQIFYELKTLFAETPSQMFSLLHCYEINVFI